MKALSTVGVLSTVFFVSSLALAAEKKEFKATCPVSGGPAKESSSLKYKGKNLYFCCNNCPEAYKKDRKKFATKANLQLVQTGQAVQVACPMCNNEGSADTTLKVAGVSVVLGCGGCKGKIEKAADDEQLAMLFSNKAFGKGFTLQTKCPVSGKAINAKCSTDYKDKKVYFCCPNCLKAFNESPDKFADKLPQPRAKKKDKKA